MSDLGPERLYGLLPEILRYSDAEAGQGLRAFLAVFDQEYAAIERGIAALYDDWFVETCEEWVLPYIGDLVGVRSSTLAHALTSRAFVGRSLHYRRRKGTPDALAGAASDATGWPALAVPSFALLAATQSMLDPHPDRGGTVDLRRLVAGAGGQLSRFGGPFDTIQRNVQVCECGDAPLSGMLSISLSGNRGRYSLERIGVFFWRLASFPVTRAAARAVAAGTYTVHPFGIDSLLFNPPRRREGRPREALLPTPLDAATLNAEAAALARKNGAEDGFLSPEPAVEIGVRYAGTIGAVQRIPPQAMLFCDLSSWSPPPTSVPLPGGNGERAIQVAIDPALGRIAFPKGIEVERLEVSYAYAFSGDLGGGPYARPTEAGERADWRAEVGSLSSENRPATEPGREADIQCFTSFAEAIAAWNDAAQGSDDTPAQRVGHIRIASDDLYDLSASTPFSIDLATSDGLGRRLEIVAASGERPCLTGNLLVRGPESEGNSQEPSAALLLDGLWIDGAIVLSGDLSSLTLAHCTVRPTRRTALAFTGTTAPKSLEVAIRSSLVGAIRLPTQGCRLDVSDSIVDAAGGATAIGGSLGPTALTDPPGPTSRLTRSTIFGQVHLMELSFATDTLFVDKVVVDRRTQGLVRRSYLPPGSTTPHRESELPDGTPPPTFTSRIYGQPGYAQLGPDCPHPISRGRYGELGAFHSLRQPARLALLPEIAAEFLPWGLEAEIVFAT